MAKKKLNEENAVLSLDSIIPYENNPRDNDASVPFVAKSIEKYGYRGKIQVDENHVILAGHTRLKALKLLHMQGKLDKGKLSGITESSVPVIVIKDLSEADKKAYRLAENKVGENSGWKFDLLDIELKDIGELDPTFIPEDFGFITVEEPPAIEEVPKEDEDGPEEIDVTDSKPKEEIFIVNVFFDNSEDADDFLLKMKDQGYKCRME